MRRGFVWPLCRLQGCVHGIKKKRLWYGRVLSKEGVVVSVQFLTIIDGFGRRTVELLIPRRDSICS